MESETVFEYRHKKFGVRKRSADEESDLSTRDEIQVKRPKKETAAEDIKFMAEVQLEPVNLSPRHRSQEDVQVVDLSIESQTDTAPDAMASPEERQMASGSPNSSPGSTSPVERHSDEVEVKNESLTLPRPTRTTTRRRGRSSKANNPEAEGTSTSSPAPSDLISVKIKEELIEINTTIKEQIPEQTFEEICRFHENMVRRFPKKDRSPREQDRRNKNTVACRKSRRVRKLSAALEESDYKSKYALYKDQMREYFILEKYSQFIMALAKTESTVIVVD